MIPIDQPLLAGSPGPIKRTQKLAWGLLGLLLAWNVWLIGTSATDIPYADDYGTLLDFVSTVHEQGFSWEQLWAQQSEHRPVVGRLVTLTVDYAFGRIDFAALTAAGNLEWLACLILVGIAAYREGRCNAWILLAAIAILVVPTHHENSQWGIAGLAFYGLTAFSLLCLHGISRLNLWVAIMAFVAAVLTSSAGFILLPIALCDLALKREWRRSIIFGVTGLALAAVFFWQHQRVPSIPEGPQSRNVLVLAQYAFCFLGGAFPGKTLATGAGCLLSLALAAVILRRQKDTFLSMSAAFILLTAGAAAWSRSGMGIEQALDSRYSVFSLLGLVCCLIAAVSASHGQRIRWLPQVLTGGGLLLAAYLTWSVFAADRWRLQQVKRLTDFYLVINRTRWNGHLAPYLDRARKLGVYDGWAAAAAVRRILPDPGFGSNAVIAPSRGHVDIFEGDYLLGWAHLQGRDSSRCRIRVLLQGEGGDWAVPVWRYQRSDVATAFPDDGQYMESGFQVVLSNFALPPGSYRVSIIIEEGKHLGSVPVSENYLVKRPPLLLSHTALE